MNTHPNHRGIILYTSFRCYIYLASVFQVVVIIITMTMTMTMIIIIITPPPPRVHDE